MAKALLPDRYPQVDFFVCDMRAFSPKGDIASMEHPVFSLSTRPDWRTLSYRHNDVMVDITPSVRGACDDA